VTRWHLLAPEYPPDCGGVGDYTALVAAGLADAGDEVHVWYPGERGSARPIVQAIGPRLTVHRLPDRFGRASRRALATALSAEPGILLAQYVPGAFGARGLNVPFCRWLAGMRRAGADVRVMFHEPFFYFGLARPWRNVFAVVQRAMAAMLLRASTRVYYSTETWTRLLAIYRPPAHADVLPIPATIPADIADEAVARARDRRKAGFVMGHFGTYGDHIGRQLDEILPALLRRLPVSRVLLVGRGSEAFARTMPPDVRDRVDASGSMTGVEAAAALRACDLLVQPYPDGVTTRRTSVMAALTTAVPVVTTSGPLTESVWAESSAVALAPARDVTALVDIAAGLAADPGARAALGARGRELYDARFALNLTIARMRQ
jgi:glycosyltransferase involved in cell wall biosynthesis